MKHLSLLVLVLFLLACESNPQKAGADRPSGSSRPYGIGSIYKTTIRKPQPGMDKEDILLIFSKPYRTDKIMTANAYEFCGPKGTQVERWSYEVTGKPYDGLPVNILFQGDLVCAVTNTN